MQSARPSPRIVRRASASGVAASFWVSAEEEECPGREAGRAWMALALVPFI